MLNLGDWPLAARRRITGVFTDIDNTLTTDGAITPDAAQAQVGQHHPALAFVAPGGSQNTSGRG